MSTGSSQISNNLSWHLRQILAGRLGLAEFASKLLIAPEFTSKAKLLGLKPDLLVTIMCDTVLQVLKNHADKALSDRTPNGHVKQMLYTEFRFAYFNFAKSHPTYASETLRTLYLDHLQEQREQLESDAQTFETGLQGMERPALPHMSKAMAQTQAMLSRPQEAADGERPIQTQKVPAGHYEKLNVLDKIDDPAAVMCPNCKRPGLHAVYRVMKAGGKLEYFDAVMHHVLTPAGIHKSTYHRTRHIDADTGEMLRDEYRVLLRNAQRAAGQAVPPPQERTKRGLYMTAARRRAAADQEAPLAQVTCIKCGKPGIIAERVLRDTKRMEYKRIKAVSHGRNPYHTIETLETRRLTDAERDEVLAGSASKGRRKVLAEGRGRYKHSQTATTQPQPPQEAAAA